jgi:hypothetical protein
MHYIKKRKNDPILTDPICPFSSAIKLGPFGALVSSDALKKKRTRHILIPNQDVGFTPRAETTFSVLGGGV